MGRGGSDSEKAGTDTRELTGEEAALYDRQIRLWGLEAQRRLASSKILLVGDVCSLLGHEIAKNIVLAGVARLGLGNTEAVSGKLPEGGFLGRDLASTVASLQDMNPHVDVCQVDAPLKQIESFSVVCAIGLGRRSEVEISKQCRDSKVPFLTGRTAGPMGWVFLDLGENYKHQAKFQEARPEAATASSVTREVESSFCSYVDALEAPWRKQTRRSEFGWHVACCLQEFNEQNGRLPGAESDDTPVLLEIYEKLCAEKKSSDSKKELLERASKTSHVCLPPVAAIVGGIWAREVIKVTSGKDTPLKNFFFFNADTSAGSVEYVGPPK